MILNKARFGVRSGRQPDAIKIEKRYAHADAARRRIGVLVPEEHCESIPAPKAFGSGLAFWKRSVPLGTIDHRSLS